MKASAWSAIVVGLLVIAGPARAGEVKVSFVNGRVTVVATDASPREILGEWARLGQVRVTNLERLAGGPVTLQLTDVPEARALETILRGTAGFVAAPRVQPVATMSSYDRLVLMPGVAPAVAAAPAASAASRPSEFRPARGGRVPVMPGADAGESPAAAGGITQVWGNRGLGPNGQPIQGPNWPSPVTGQFGAATDDETPAVPTSSQVPGVLLGSANAPGATTGAARPGESTGAPAPPARTPYGAQGGTPPAVVNPLANQYGTPPTVRQPVAGPIKLPN